MMNAKIWKYLGTNDNIRPIHALRAETRSHVSIWLEIKGNEECCLVVVRDGGGVCEFGFVTLAEILTRPDPYSAATHFGGVTVTEYKQIFDDLDAEYERCILDNKNLTIKKKILLIKNDCLIVECLEKDIYSIMLSSDIVVPPSSNYLYDDLRLECDREHNKVLELEAKISK
ncbi:hypothetical protein Tco_1327021 [Tanacetum coccineum]